MNNAVFIFDIFSFLSFTQINDPAKIESGTPNAKPIAHRFAMKLVLEPSAFLVKMLKTDAINTKSKTQNAQLMSMVQIDFLINLFVAIKTKTFISEY